MRILTLILFLFLFISTASFASEEIHLKISILGNLSALADSDFDNLVAFGGVGDPEFSLSICFQAHNEVAICPSYYHFINKGDVVLTVPEKYFSSDFFITFHECDISILHASKTGACHHFQYGRTSVISFLQLMDGEEITTSIMGSKVDLQIPIIIVLK